MIIIKLQNGKEYENDLSLGMNLTKDGIWECLHDVGYYELHKNDGSFSPWKRIYKDDVKEIIELQ